MDKSGDSARQGLIADGSAAVEHKANMTNSHARPMGLSDFAQNFDLLFEEVETSWREQALCAQTDPDSFFPEKGGSTREAKRVCQACQVRDECLEFALANDERFGIWGGLSERERRKLKKSLG